VISAINETAFARRRKCALDICLILVQFWSILDVESKTIDMFPPVRSSESSIVFLHRAKKKARRYRDQLFPSIYFLSFVSTIGYKAFHRETADLPSSLPFTSARLTLIFDVSEPRRSESPRGLFDQRTTKGGRKRSLSLAEIISEDTQRWICAHHRSIPKYRFPNYARTFLSIVLLNSRY